MMKSNANDQYHTCAYCRKVYIANKPASHIIPKQFFRKFKIGINNKNAYSTYFGRMTQMEPKEYLLCPECEEVFSNWETEFARSITNKLYEKESLDHLIINKKVKLGALSILWRIIRCWVITDERKKGSLKRSDIEYLSNYDKLWLNILREQRDFSIKEANIYIIPISCIKSVNDEIENYKKYPGIMANIVYYDQGDGKGYYCVRCLAHRIVIFAYLTSSFTIPSNFSLHNDIIKLTETIMPPSIVKLFIDYANDASRIRL